jgi:hypothetical protein
MRCASEQMASPLLQRSLVKSNLLELGGELVFWGQSKDQLLCPRDPLGTGNAKQPMPRWAVSTLRHRSGTVFGS